VKIPNKTVQSLLSFCLPSHLIEEVKERIEMSRNKDLAAIKEVKPFSFYKPLTHPCFYQYQGVSKILASDGNRILCYQISTSNVSARAEPIFISIDKKALTEKWIWSVTHNEKNTDLESLMLEGEILPTGNIFELAVNDQIAEIGRLLQDDFVEINAQFLLDAISAAIASSSHEVATIRLSSENGKMLLFQGEKMIGVIMGIN
jgi:hypothetical protein